MGTARTWDNDDTEDRTLGTVRTLWGSEDTGTARTTECREDSVDSKDSERTVRTL